MPPSAGVYFDLDIWNQTGTSARILCKINQMEESKKEELRKRIMELTAIKNELKNEEQAVKLTMNSIYGAVGNSHFVCKNPDVAEAVTLQGQDLIKFAEKIINKYFHEHWHLDNELHEKLGVANVKRIYKPLVVYIDTDSASADTIVRVSLDGKKIKEITFELLFKVLSDIYAIELDERGNEIIRPNLYVENYSSNQGIKLSSIRRVIRHMVTKEKWTLSAGGKSIDITGDHSLMVERQGVLEAIKPSDVQSDDIVLISNGSISREKIESCQVTGMFEDEYVYDIEVDEAEYNSQTFFGNGILVHNSNYVSFEEVVNSCDWKGDAQDLVLQINEHRLSGYLKNCMEIYAKKWGTQNAQDFELETLSHNAIFIGKKKYVVNLAYDSGISIPSLKELKFTGVEMIKGGTPPFVREKLVYLTKYIFDQGPKFKLVDFVKEIKSIKKEFKIQAPDLISAGITANNLEKFILNDTSGLEVGGSCPIHVRASGYHNYILNNSKFKSKYPLIRSGEKVRWYFVKTKKESDCNVFAYSQGSYPYEYAPPIDYDVQFTKTILDPINRFVEAMGLNPISPNLFTITALF